MKCSGWHGNSITCWRIQLSSGQGSLDRIKYAILYQHASMGYLLHKTSWVNKKLEWDVPWIELSRNKIIKGMKIFGWYLFKYIFFLSYWKYHLLKIPNFLCINIYWETQVNHSQIDKPCYITINKAKEFTTVFDCTQSMFFWYLN